MRKGEGGRLDDGVAVDDEVEIQRAVRPPAHLRAAPPAVALLDRVQVAEQHARREAGVDERDRVQVRGRRGIRAVQGQRDRLDGVGRGDEGRQRQCVEGVEGGVDFKMGGVLVAGGVLGTGAGAWIFRRLQELGQIDTVIGVVYVLMLGSIGGLMLREALSTIGLARRGQPPRARKRRHHPLVASLPFRTRFYASGLYISPLAPLLLGFATGILTMLLGIGGGFILVPAMIYLLGMATGVVVGTSLFQTLFVTAVATMVHATTTQAVDIVLAGLLLLGSVTGAQVGARLATKVKPEYLRLALALMVLGVGLRILLGLVWRPEEIFTVTLS